MKFEWDDKCQSSFERLKEILVEAPVLIQHTSGRDYTKYSDASRIGLGCVLMQDGKVVAYACKQLKPFLTKLSHSLFRVNICSVHFGNLVTLFIWRKM